MNITVTLTTTIWRNSTGVVLLLYIRRFYEGFGIPPLEAMQCGTIVVASDTSSIPEVVGDAGILFDPHRIKDLTEILLGVLNGSSMREDIIAKGYQRAKEFCWEKTVNQTVGVYRSLAP